MMNASNEPVQSLLEQAAARERRARRRAILLTIIPTVFAVALIWYSVNLVQQMTEELVRKQKELVLVTTQLIHIQTQVDGSQQDLNLMQVQLTDTEQELENAQKELANMQDCNQSLVELQGKYEGLQKEYETLQQDYDALVNSLRDVGGQSYRGDPQSAMKSLSNRFPLEARMLDAMLAEYQKTPWKLGGFSPEEGFDSPGFAAHMLEQYGLLSQPAVEARDNLREALKPLDKPGLGDLVFYELGYSMFYYEDERGNPFVVGMTPLGVMALQPDFARITGYGDVPYP